MESLLQINAPKNNLPFSVSSNICVTEFKTTSEQASAPSHWSPLHIFFSKQNVGKSTIGPRPSVWQQLKDKIIVEFFEWLSRVCFSLDCNQRDEMLKCDGQTDRQTDINSDVDFWPHWVHLYLWNQKTQCATSISVHLIKLIC